MFGQILVSEINVGLRRTMPLIVGVLPMNCLISTNRWQTLNLILPGNLNWCMSRVHTVAFTRTMSSRISARGLYLIASPNPKLHTKLVKIITRRGSITVTLRRCWWSCRCDLTSAVSMSKMTTGNLTWCYLYYTWWRHGMALCSLFFDVTLVVLL